MKKSKGATKSSKDEVEWETKIPMLENDKCGLCSVKDRVSMPAEIYMSAKDLAKGLDSEWFAYLKGSIDGNNIRVSAMEVPEQEASATYCETTPEAVDPEVIGWIHSHVEMSAFFSVTDRDTAQSHLLTMVINRKGEIKALVRKALPCGFNTFGEAEVDITYEHDTSSFVEAAKAKVKERKVPQVYVRNFAYPHGSNFFWNKESKGGNKSPLKIKTSSCPYLSDPSHECDQYDSKLCADDVTRTQLNCPIETRLVVEQMRNLPYD